MKKSDRIAQFVETLRPGGDASLDPRYHGFFQCFNEQRYYEAHDVLEDLWLERRDENYAFYKGLIQVAGAFVHLQKQYLHPDHPHHGRRLQPASRLFALAEKNLRGYGENHLLLDVGGLRELCESQRQALEASDFMVNPWRPESAPAIHLNAAVEAKNG